MPTRRRCRIRVARGKFLVTGRCAFDRARFPRPLKWMGGQQPNRRNFNLLENRPYKGE